LVTVARIFSRPDRVHLLAEVFHTTSDPTLRMGVNIRGMPCDAATTLARGMRGVRLCLAAASLPAFQSVQEPWQLHTGACPTLDPQELGGVGSVGAGGGPGEVPCLCTALLPLLPRGSDCCAGPASCRQPYLVSLPVAQGPASRIVSTWVVRPGRWRPDFQLSLEVPQKPEVQQQPEVQQ
jgi:hypothetical protein